MIIVVNRIIGARAMGVDFGLLCKGAYSLSFGGFSHEAGRLPGSRDEGRQVFTICIFRGKMPVHEEMKF
jgi:hypothetical protein